VYGVYYSEPQCIETLHRRDIMLINMSICIIERISMPGHHIIHLIAANINFIIFVVGQF